MGKGKNGKDKRNNLSRTAFVNDKKKEKNNFKKAGKRSKAEETRFIDHLNEQGYTINFIKGDGNCLFRSLADQIEDNEENHFRYRERIMAYIETHKDHFGLFLEDDEPFDDYMKRLRTPAEWGGHQELYAASQCLNVNIIVHQIDAPRYKLEAADGSTAPEIHLSYHGECHYNSVKAVPGFKEREDVQRRISEAKDRAFESQVAAVSRVVKWARREDVVEALRVAKGLVDDAIGIICSGILDTLDIGGSLAQQQQKNGGSAADNSGRTVGDSAVSDGECGDIYSNVRNSGTADNGDGGRSHIGLGIMADEDDNGVGARAVVAVPVADTNATAKKGGSKKQSKQAERDNQKQQQQPVELSCEIVITTNKAGRPMSKKVRVEWSPWLWFHSFIFSNFRSAYPRNSAKRHDSCRIARTGILQPQPVAVPAVRTEQPPPYQTSVLRTASERLCCERVSDCVFMCIGV